MLNSLVGQSRSVVEGQCHLPATQLKTYGVFPSLLTRRQVLRGLTATPVFFSSAILAQEIESVPIVLELAGRTRELYHDEQLAHRIANHLLARLSEGAFIDSKSAGQLSAKLNSEIAAVSADIHFMVMAGAMGHASVPPTPPHSEVPPLSRGELAHLTKVGFGIANVEILSGNVGRLDLRHFYRPAVEVRNAIGAAMAKLADSSAIIIDLSQNPGGDPRAVAYLLSYFFMRPPFVVNRFYWRNRPVEEFRTEVDLEGPRYGETRPLIVQVSTMTFSAAEEFAYDIQALKRGIIRGDVTGGGANHALPVELPGGLQAYIPQARAENPLTRRNWERTGVTPDKLVRSPEASRAAHDLARELSSDAARRA